MPTVKRRSGSGQRMGRSARGLLVLLNAAAYFFLLRWAIHNIQPDKLLAYFRAVPTHAVLGSLLVNVAAFTLAGFRMASLLGRPFLTGFSIVNMGSALNALFPLRLGDPANMFLTNKLFSLPLTAIVAGAFAEKLIDLVMTVMLASIVVVFVTTKFIQTDVMVSAGIAACVAIAAVVVFRLYVVRIVKLLPKGSRLRRLFIELHKHSSSYRLGRLFALSIGIWLLHILLVYLSFNTYLPEVKLDVVESISLLLFIALAVAIPSAPAGLGVFEAAVVVYLTQKFHVDNEAALAVATLFHLAITLPQLVVALSVLWRNRGLLKVKTPHSVASC